MCKFPICFCCLCCLQVNIVEAAAKKRAAATKKAFA